MHVPRTGMIQNPRTAAVSEHCRSRFLETIKYRWTDAVVVLAQFPCIFLSDPDLGGSCGWMRNTTIYILLHKEKKKNACCKDHSRAWACVTYMEMGV